MSTIIDLALLDGLLVAAQSGEHNDAFHLDDGEEVSCYQCSKHGDHTQYRRGEAFLVGPGHYPYDGNANYFCAACLPPEVTVWEPSLQLENSDSN